MDWTRGPPIGKGSSAAVYLATSATGELFAVKSADISSSMLLQREHSLISQLSSPYVVKCFGSGTTFENHKPVYNIFLEYVSGGTISEQIARQGGSLDEGLIQFYAHQILLGLSYLHLNGIVHRDIKGQNILIGEDGGLKIADFGCAHRVESSNFSKEMFAGTPAYMAPEVARGEEQSFPADIWSLGCTVIEMATGSNPWPEMKDPASALYRIANSGDVPEIPALFSDSGKDFLSKCLTRDRNERWTAAELLQHDFLGGSCGEIREEFTRKSPTSVMDQGFWDSLEESDSSRNATNISSTLESPANRIKDLFTDVPFSSNLKFPDWAPAEDDDWVTVRYSAEIEECRESVNQDSELDSIASESDTSSGVRDEDFQTSIAVEDSLFDCFNVVISDLDGVDTVPVICSNDTEKDVSAIFERISMESFSHKDQLLPFSSIFIVLKQKVHQVINFT
ncbi:mitogen-activated protein kinase kinase kinase 18-like [Primulina eburnea]|uniref:mitogen-activated protein kinase kinase kinase 18-like n=1 Tax=Primulina eburnea TaxID=1245227 RepID=UPI003C6CAAD1